MQYNVYTKVEEEAGGVYNEKEEDLPMVVRKFHFLCEFS